MFRPQGVAPFAEDSDMSRHRRSSRPELVRLTPWVLGSGIAALAVAALQLPAARSGLAAAAPAVGALVGLLLAGAAAWQWRRRTRGRVPGPVSKGRREFEARVTEAFAVQGYQLVPGGTGGAVDMVLRRDRGTFLVHLREWDAAKVGIEPLRELQAELQTRAAQGGFVVTLGRFGRDAQRFAGASPLRLIDGAVLAQWLGR